MRRMIATLTLLCLAAVPALARADDLVVTTIEYDTWPVAVAALQADTGSEGRVLHVVVRDASGAPLGCGRYALVLDAVGAQAFALGTCEPATSATDVTLVHRSALFAHGDIVAQPLAAGITALQVRSGSTAGGAQNVGGSEMLCSTAVRPFLTDLETGRRVYLTPDRFHLRPAGASITVVPEPGGWMLQGHGQTTLAIDYEVLDAARNEVVLHDRAVLSCGTTAANGGAAGVAVPVVPPRPTLRAHPDTAVLLSMNALNLSLANLGDAMLNSDTHALGRTAGLGWMAGGGSGALGLVVEAPWFLGELQTGWHSNDSAWEVDVRATVGPALRLGAARLYAGPTLALYYLQVSDDYSRVWNSGAVVMPGATLGFRWNFVENRNVTAGRFFIADIFVESVAPIPVNGPGQYLLTAGFSTGHGW
jgi:hypothetical protein